MLVSAVSVDYSIIIFNFLAHIFPDPSLWLDSQNLSWCLFEETCIKFHQLLHKGSMMIQCTQAQTIQNARVMDQLFSTSQCFETLVQSTVFWWPPTIKLYWFYFTTVILLESGIIKQISDVQVMWYATSVKGSFHPQRKPDPEFEIWSHSA